MSAPSTGWRARLRRLLITLAGVYAALCLVMFLAQGALLFHPTAHRAEVQQLRAEPQTVAIDIAADGVQLRGVLLPARASSPGGRRPTILYFGGNAEPVTRSPGRFDWARERGANVVLAPYRGYDDSTGTPSADGLRRDAVALYDHVRGLDVVDPERIYAFGFSLGTGVATHLAHERPLAGVILAAPFARLSDIAQRSYPWLPVRPLFRHDFDSLALAPAVTTPALIVHGEADALIPIAEGARLQAAWGGAATLVPIVGAGHNDVVSRAPTTAAMESFVFGL